MFPYGYLILALAVLGAIAGAGYKGYSLGADSVRVEWNAAALKEANANSKALQEASDRERAKEQESARKLSAASKAYQKGLANAETAKLRALDAVHTGALKLRLTESAGCEVGGSGTGTIAASAGGRDGGETGQFLGQADSAFLVALASEADQVTLQLSACQEVVRSDRQ